MSSNLVVKLQKDIRIDAKIKMMVREEVQFILFDIIDPINILNVKTDEIDFYELVHPDSTYNVILYLTSLFNADSTNMYSKLRTVMELVDNERQTRVNYKFEFTPEGDIFSVVIKPVNPSKFSPRHFRHNIRSNIVSSILNVEELLEKFIRGSSFDQNASFDEFMRINANTIDLLKESLLLFDQEHLESIPTPNEPSDSVQVESYAISKASKDQKFVKVFNEHEEKPIANATDISDELLTYTYLIKEVRKISRHIKIQLCKLPILEMEILQQIIDRVRVATSTRTLNMKIRFSFHDGVLTMTFCSVENLVCKVQCGGVVRDNVFDERFITSLNTLLNKRIKTVMLVDDSLTNIKILSHTVYTICDKQKPKGMFDEHVPAMWMCNDYFIIDITDDTAFMFLSNGQIAKTFIEILDVDILITDIEMPKMTGVQLIKFIFENNYAMKIAIQSALDRHLILEMYPEISENIRIIQKGSHYSLINDILSSILC